MSALTKAVRTTEYVPTLPVPPRTHALCHSECPFARAVPDKDTGSGRFAIARNLAQAWSRGGTTITLLARGGDEAAEEAWFKG